MSDNNQELAARTEGIQLIERGNYLDAVKMLKQHVAQHPDGESHALLALAHFQLEEYDSAVEQYEAALQHDPDKQAWRDMLKAAKANAIAEVHVPVPDIYYFDRDKLLAQPAVPKGVLPSPPPPAPAPGLLKRARLVLGNVLGRIATFAMGALTQLVGRFLGYRDEVWTNWYRRRFTLAILTLAYMREQLNKNNLRSTYPAGALVGFQPKGQSSPEGATHFRTADGSWNNLDDPKEGAAGTRFPRNVENGSIRPETEKHS